MIVAYVYLFLLRDAQQGRLAVIQNADGMFYESNLLTFTQRNKSGKEEEIVVICHVWSDSKLVTLIFRACLINSSKASATCIIRLDSCCCRLEGYSHKRILLFLLTATQQNLQSIFISLFCVIAGVTSTSLVKSEPLPQSKGSSALSSSLPRDSQLKRLLKSPSTNSLLTDEDSLSSGEGKNPIKS